MSRPIVVIFLTIFVNLVGFGIIIPLLPFYAETFGASPLVGRDRELAQFDVTLERVGAARPDRSMVLSGLRGVGTTVRILLPASALRAGAAPRQGHDEQPKSAAAVTAL